MTNAGLTADAWDGLGAVTAEPESERVKDGGMEVEKEQEEEEELIESKVVAQKLEFAMSANNVIRHDLTKL